jgi:hypothetical protein
MTYITGLFQRFLVLLQAGTNTTTITRHQYHHFPTLSLEHLNLSLDCPPSPTLLIYSNLGLQLWDGKALYIDMIGDRVLF